MKTHRLLAAPAALFRAAVLGVLLSLPFVPVQADAPAPDADQRRFEVRFLTNMIDHHHMAVEMAKLCEGRATHPELIEMCNQIKTSQTAEIATMRSWLQSWYGMDHAPAMDARGQKQLEALASLSGAEFEIAFMTEMIGHHAIAVRRSLSCLLNAYHAEMLDVCAMMLAAQGDEIGQLRLWLCQWYSICNLEDDHDDREAP